MLRFRRAGRRRRNQADANRSTGYETGNFGKHTDALPYAWQDTKRHWTGPTGRQLLGLLGERRYSGACDVDANTFYKHRSRTRRVEGNITFQARNISSPDPQRLLHTVLAEQVT